MRPPPHEVIAYRLDMKILNRRRIGDDRLDTTVALRKALARIQNGMRPGQKVLFLSFSRAAVTRPLSSMMMRTSTSPSRPRTIASSG